MKQNETEVKPAKCDVRLSQAELAMLNELSETNEVTKSDVMRKALKVFYDWCTKE